MVRRSLVEKNGAFLERKKLSVWIKLIHRAKEAGKGAFATGKRKGSRENTGAVEVNNPSLRLTGFGADKKIRKIEIGVVDAGIVHVRNGLHDFLCDQLSFFRWWMSLQPGPPIEKAFGFMRDEGSSVETKGYAFYSSTEYLDSWNTTFAGGFSPDQFCKRAGRVIPVEVVDQVTDKSTTFIGADDSIAFIAKRDALDGASPAMLAFCTSVFEVSERFEDFSEQAVFEPPGMGICFLFMEAAWRREAVEGGAHGVVRFPVDRCTFAVLLRQAQHERIPPGAKLLLGPSGRIRM